MSDITVINDSQQSDLVTNGLAKNGELYLKASGSTNAGAIVVYDNGSWRTFANEAVSFSNTYSLDFDGTDDDFYLNSGVSFSGAFTFSFWFKYEANNFPHLLAPYIFLYGPSYGSGVYVRSLGTITVSNGYSADTWHHLAYVRDSSNNTTLYIDGSSIGTSSSSATATVRQFAKNGSTDPLGGKIDEIALWNSDQTSNLATIYNSGAPADLSGLSPTHWYRMGDINGSSGTTITDQGSGGVDGELRNGTTYSTDIPS